MLNADQKAMDFFKKAVASSTVLAEMPVYKDGDYLYRSHINTYVYLLIRPP
jgi:hypothetical protein